jgi:hypothetical protein
MEGIKLQLLIRIILYTSLFFVPFSPQILSAQEKEPSFINSFEEDITGDGFHEYAKIQGNLLREDSSFYQNIWIDMTSKFNKEWSISLQNGYDPQIKLIDLNHDQVFDLFYQIAKDENKNHFHYQFYTLKGGTVKQLPLPNPMYSKGTFEDDFQVHIQLNPNEKPLVIDVSPKKDSYITGHLYDEKGHLLENKRITIESIATLEPLLISESKGYGLKSMQTVYGVDRQDKIGEIETLWYFKKDEWIILKSHFHPSH